MVNDFSPMVVVANGSRILIVAKSLQCLTGIFSMLSE